MTGEVLHRERNVRLDQILGALPLPNRLRVALAFSK
jgi:hypothetical protein